MGDDHSASNYPGLMEVENTITNQYGTSRSEDDSLESELSSDTETSSDSGITSSDSDDKEEDEASEHDSSIADTISDQDALDDDSNIITIPTQPRPALSHSTTVSDLSDLHSRIATFLPQLRKANEDLVNAEEDHRLDAVADDEDHYIEMDLGLGVLKEKARPRPLDGEIWTRESSSSSASSSSSDSDSETEGPEEDALRDLLGGKEKGRREGRPAIQPLDET
jgi:hypothetical protein